MKKTAFIIMLITLVSKFLGFSRDITLSYFFGASSISDAYLVSMTIPSVIFGFVGSGIMTAYIPMQSRVLDEEGDLEASKFTSNFTNVILLLITFILITGLFFTENIVKLFAMGFYGETLRIAVIFTKISMFGMYFTALISIFSGYLQIKKKYIIPALIGFPLNIIMIISIYYASKYNQNILAYGALLGAVAQFILLVPFIKKNNFEYDFLINLKDERLLRTISIALPAIIGISVNQVNTLIDRTIASSLAEGGISALNYADRLNLFIQGIFVTSIITVMYPTISSYASKNNYDEIKKSLTEFINIIIICVVPITVGAMIYSEDIIVLLFGRGKFDINAIEMTSIALFYYSVGMIGFGIREVLSRVFYSLQDTKTPVINATIGMFLNIFLNIILSEYLGIGGLALATSISAIFTSLLLFRGLRKKIGSIGIKKMSIVFAKIMITSLVMGAISKISFNYLSGVMSQSKSLLSAIAIGAIVYTVIILYMKIDEIDLLASKIKTKIK